MGSAQRNGILEIGAPGKWSGRKLDQLRKFLVELAPALRAGKPRQFQRFFARSWRLIEQAAQLDQSGADGIRKRPFQALAERLPI